VDCYAELLARCGEALFIVIGNNIRIDGRAIKNPMFTFDINSTSELGIREWVYSELNYRNRTSFDSNVPDSMASFQQVSGFAEGNGQCYPFKWNPWL
jgi:hypothetical protein